MAIVLGFVCVLILLFAAIIVSASRLLLLLGALMLVIACFHLFVIMIVSVMVGVIAFCILFDLMSPGHTGILWAGAISVGLLTAWQLLLVLLTRFRVWREKLRRCMLLDCQRSHL